MTLDLASDDEDVARSDSEDSESDAAHQELFESSDDGTLVKRSANLSCLEQDDCNDATFASSDDGEMVMQQFW